MTEYELRIRQPEDGSGIWVTFVTTDTEEKAQDYLDAIESVGKPKREFGIFRRR